LISCFPINLSGALSTRDFFATTLIQHIQKTVNIIFINTVGYQQLMQTGGKNDRIPQPVWAAAFGLNGSEK